MEDALWGACDPQSLQRVGTFNGAESLLSSHHAEFPTYWACDEISDINLMSVESLAAFDHPLMSLHHPVADSIQQQQQQPQWGPPEFFNPTVVTTTQQDVPLQEILNGGQFHFNPSPAAVEYPSYKSFGSVIRTTTSYGVGGGGVGGGGSSSNSSSRPYGVAGSSSSSAASMFVPPQRIISTDHRNVVGVVESSSRGRDCEEPKMMTSFNPGPYVNSAATTTTLPTPKPVSLPLPIPNSARQQHHHRQVSSSSPVMNLSGFEPSARPMSQVSSSPRPMSQVSSSPRPMSQVSSSPRPMSQVSSSPRPMSQVSSSPRPISQVSSSPVMSMSYGEQRVVMSSSSPSLTFESSRHPKSSSLKPSSSPLVPTVVGFEPIPQQQQHQSSSPSPTNMMVVGSPQQQRQQQQQKQPALSTSPPLSNLSFEPRQPPPPAPPSMSNSPPTSNLVFEPTRPPPTPSPRQQATTSNINNSNHPRSDVVVVEPASKWPPLRIVGSEKALFSPQTDTIKYPIPKSTSAVNSIPAPNAVNPANKRPLSADDNKNNNQGGSMNKKLMQKWQGGCSRLEEISNAAHQKVTQNTSGRALGPALNTNLKPRARQGSANDPQSIAARVRRERISERLKVLQTLIPNGDKVDMVTMLEKAINYVQCLELQIRMLKNDSLWPKALGPLPNTLQELLELAGPEFLGGKDLTEEPTTATEKTSTSKKVLVPAEVIEFDGNQPSADKE